MKKKLAIVLAVLLVLASFTACGGKKEAAKQEANVFYGGGTPLYMDPALNSASAGSNIIKLSHAGLMGFQWVDGEAKLAPELAEGYEVSEDGTVYTFTLREGLKWSDGSDFTVQDIIDSWNRAASEDLGADYGFLYDVIDGYPNNLNLVADGNKLIVTLAGP